VSVWTLIDSKDAPVTGVFDFAALTLTGYTVLEIHCSGLTVTNDATNILLTFYVAGAEITAGYRWGMDTVSSAGANNADGDASDPAIMLHSNDANWNVGNAAGEGFDASIRVDAPTSAVLYKRAQFECAFTGPTGVAIGVDGIGLMDNAGAITGLKISGSSALLTGMVHILGKN
jgi:hypothetical protein